MEMVVASVTAVLAPLPLVLLALPSMLFGCNLSNVDFFEDCECVLDDDEGVVCSIGDRDVANEVGEKEEEGGDAQKDVECGAFAGDDDADDASLSSDLLARERAAA